MEKLIYCTLVIVSYNEKFTATYTFICNACKYVAAQYSHTFSYNDIYNNQLAICLLSIQNVCLICTYVKYVHMYCCYIYVLLQIFKTSYIQLAICTQCCKANFSFYQAIRTFMLSCGQLAIYLYFSCHRCLHRKPASYM